MTDTYWTNWEILTSEFGKLSDGTYYKDRHGNVFNYGVRWNYGYIVATGPIMEFPEWITGNEREQYIRKAITELPNKTLFGIWNEPDSGYAFVDYVRHVDSYTDAMRIARETNQKCIWDIRGSKCIYVDN